MVIGGLLKLFPKARMCRPPSAIQSGAKTQKRPLSFNRRHAYLIHWQMDNNGIDGIEEVEEEFRCISLIGFDLPGWISIFAIGPRRSGRESGCRQRQAQEVKI